MMITSEYPITYLSNLRKALIDAGKDERYLNACLHYASRLIENGLPVIFDNTHFALLLGLPLMNLYNYIGADQTRFYHEMKIPKANGEFRTLNIPSIDLKYIQRWLLVNILDRIQISPSATGFVKQKSIIDNADTHTGARIIINVDIKDFFPSIAFDRIFRIFYYYGYTKELAYTFARLCTYKDYLPQGSPASPILSNIVCKKMDKRFSVLVSIYNLKYSRYADDITISGDEEVKGLLPIINTIIEDEGFKLNPAKTRLRRQHQRQEVTGLNINAGHVTIPRSYIRKLRQEIYYCKKYGVDSHMAYIQDSHTFYREHLLGKAYYVFMVNRELGSKLLNEIHEINWD